MSPSNSRARAESYSDRDKKLLIKSLLDLFLETTAQEESENHSEISVAQVDSKLLEDIKAFLYQVALCYQSYGCPTRTIEMNMGKFAKGLGISAQFLVFPSHIFMEIDNVMTEKNITQRHNHIFRSSYGYNFYKLQLVDELVRRVSSYAQEAKDISTAQNVSAEAVDEAFTRARALSSASSVTGGGIPMPSQAVLTGTYYQYNARYNPHDLKNSKNQQTNDTLIEERQSLLGSPRISNVSDDGSCEKDPNSESSLSPTLQQKLASWPNLPSIDLATQPSITCEEEEKSNELAKVILGLARMGPNVYETEGAKDSRTERTYRNLFSKLAVEDGVKLIKAVIKQKPQYSLWLKVLLVGTSSFGACGLFYRGSWTDCAICLCLGVLIGTIELISLVSPTFSRIYEFVATFVASIIIRAVNAHAPSVCYRAVLLGTIVFCLQGVTITLAFVDLMTKDLITGTTRLFFGMLVSALIGFAMDISTSTYAALTERTYESVAADSHCDNPVSRGWYPLLFVIMSMSFNVLLEAHINQLLQMLFITACSYLVYYFLAMQMTNQVPVIVASFAASLLSNLYSRRTGQPAVVYIIPAIFLLVPGSVAASSFYTVLLLDLEGGLNLTFAVVTGALSVAIGIFAASALVPVPEVEEFFRKANAAYPGVSAREGSAGTWDAEGKSQRGLHKRAANRNSGLTF